MNQLNSYMIKSENLSLTLWIQRKCHPELVSGSQRCWTKFSM